MSGGKVVSTFPDIALIRNSASTLPVDLDPPGNPLGERPGKIDRQEPVLQRCPENLDAFGKNEGLLELAGSDAAVKVGPRRLVLLPAADDEFVLLDADVEFVFGEAGDGKRDAKDFAVVTVLRQALDILLRITVPGRLGEPVERPLDLLEAEQKRARKRRNARHSLVLSRSDHSKSPDP